MLAVSQAHPGRKVKNFAVAILCRLAIYERSSSSALAALRSAVANPSVNWSHTGRRQAVASADRA